MKVHRLTGEKGEEGTAVPVRKGVTDIAVQEGTSRVSCRSLLLNHSDLSISSKGDRSSKNRRRGNREERSAVLVTWKTRGTAGLEGRLRVTAGYPC